MSRNQWDTAEDIYKKRMLRKNILVGAYIGVVIIAITSITFLMSQ
ncbi:hypothetical protein ABEV54_02685 [Peribacillus psychrosaccharolyticus]|nr:hypothetical protein [Peribacillus psychrosaccharolyticus]MEC2054512.1 hypothetical protein [Peribacillus psychrosaccharolyticus]MED3744261.1 hypothetical protein [Peribacillus psychrosaccharolyticus]